VRLVVEYDGTDFHGWQRQPQGPSIQAALEDALARLLGAAAGPEGRAVAVVAAGRTDAGVHAAAQVCHLRTTATVPLRAFVPGLNALLPAAIAVKEAQEAPGDFHARRAARGKHYRYTIIETPVRSPLLARRAWWVRGPLDRAAMRAGAAALVGEHDFSAFRGQGCEAKTTVRLLRALDLVESPDAGGPAPPPAGLLQIDLRATAFLKHMVRNIVGTLVEIGRGRFAAADVAAILDSRDRRRAGPTAPPQGLCLMSVEYPPDPPSPPSP
jgi:tRNA pseudouridine38-40 synthase